MANTVKLKRGLETNRAGQTPVAGEPLWVTDTQYLYIGDGSTAGGLPVQIAWSNIDSTPTTLSGYGITDGLLNTTDTLTGTLTVTTAVNVDTINESSTDVGVTIEGSLLKDSRIETGDGTVGQPAYTFKGIGDDTGMYYDTGQLTFSSGNLKAMFFESAGGFCHILSSGLKVDDIEERTAAAGVTIDSMIIKDGGFESIGAHKFGATTSTYWKTSAFGTASILNSYTTGDVAAAMQFSGSDVILSASAGDVAVEYSDYTSTERAMTVSRRGATATGPILDLRKNRGTAFTNVVVNANDALGEVRFSGYDGTDYDTAANIEAIANVAGAVVTADLTYTADSHTFVGYVEAFDLNPNNNIGIQGKNFGGNANGCIALETGNNSTMGFWFGDSTHTSGQGAMACTSDGKFTVAHSMRLGYGESDSTIPGATYELDVSGDADVSGAISANSLSTTLGISAGVAGTIATGETSGSVALTINDGQGNANVTFNHIDGVADFAGNCGRIVCNTDSTTNAAITFEVKDNAATGAVTTVEYFKIEDTGCTVTGTLTETSSIRYKENIRPIDNAYETILNLSGVTYDRKDGTRQGEIGLIAEHVLPHAPQLVTYNQDGEVEGLDYSRLGAYFVEGFKTVDKQLARIDDLEARLARLEALL